VSNEHAHGRQQRCLRICCRNNATPALVLGAVLGAPGSKMVAWATVVTICRALARLGLASSMGPHCVCAGLRGCGWRGGRAWGEGGARPQALQPVSGLRWVVMHQRSPHLPCTPTTSAQRPHSTRGTGSGRLCGKERRAQAHTWPHLLEHIPQQDIMAVRARKAVRAPKGRAPLPHFALLVGEAAVKACGGRQHSTAQHT